MSKGSINFMLGSARFYVAPTGNIGIGTTPPGQKLDVNGNIEANGNVNANGTVSASSFNLGMKAFKGPIGAIGASPANWAFALSIGQTPAMSSPLSAETST